VCSDGVKGREIDSSILKEMMMMMMTMKCGSGDEGRWEGE
jgi:hypothetical protein